MKPIHLPTGKEKEYSSNLAKRRLEWFPDEYIRATLPKHWRVEGYEKSWEWASLLSDLSGIEWPFISNYDEDSPEYKSVGFEPTAEHLMQLPEISRAEFEYHIYNPWKEKQGKARQYDSPIINELLAEIDLDTLKQQAEKMGYELVRKDVQWEGDNFKFDLSQEGLGITSFLTSFDSNISIRLTPHELDTLIEKYNQFKNI